MSEQILRQAMAVHQAADDRLGKDIVAAIGTDNQKCGEAMLAIASSHLSCATGMLRIAGFTDAQVAGWLHGVADQYATSKGGNKR
jgi:hypothetical protein